MNAAAWMEPICRAEVGICFLTESKTGMIYTANDEIGQDWILYANASELQSLITPTGQV